MKIGSQTERVHARFLEQEKHWKIQLEFNHLEKLRFVVQNLFGNLLANAEVKYNSG